MSLIQARREQGGLYRPVRPPSMFRLLVAFILVVLAIWYLTRVG